MGPDCSNKISLRQQKLKPYFIIQEMKREKELGWTREMLSP